MNRNGRTGGGAGPAHERPARPRTGRPGSVRRFLRRHGAAYLFISPFFVSFAAFMVYPVVFSFFLSFKQWNGLTPMVHVGWRNYLDLARDEIFRQTLKNSVIVFFEYVPLMTFLAVVLAALLNGGALKLQAAFRTAIFMPYVTSVVAVGFVFSLLLDKQYGLVNLILSWLGFPRVGWLTTPNLIRVSLSGLVAWRWLGYNMVIMLAGLQGIPAELYDAALIDGATRTRAFFAITIPLLQPVILFSVVLSTIGTFGLFTEPFILTNATGGPMRAVLSPVMYLFSNAFSFLKFGYASAIAYIYFAILFVLTTLEWRYFGRSRA